MYCQSRVEIVVGDPAGAAHLARAARRFGCRGLVTVADEAVVANGYVDRMVSPLTESDGVIVHIVPPAEPTATSVDTIADVVRTADQPLVVAVGGGTALDTGKLAAAIAGANRSVAAYTLGARPLPRGRPVVAIPSTAGTGSEVTRTCILTDHCGRKAWVWGEELLPRLVVLDPVATATMPPHITAATGLDAFVHAVEALTGRRSATLDPGPGRQAVRMVLDHLPRAVAHGDDLDARRGMQQAAMQAGVAIDGGGTGIAHAIGHALGTLAHVPHGVAVAVGLAAALAWNIEGARGAFAPVAAAAGRSAAELPDLYAELLDACRFPAVIGRVGPLAVAVDQLATTMATAENRPMVDNNCRPTDDRDRVVLAARTLAVWDELLS